jgi:hypothetical protein
MAEAAHALGIQRPNLYRKARQLEFQWRGRPVMYQHVMNGKAVWKPLFRFCLRPADAADGPGPGSGRTAETGTRVGGSAGPSNHRAGPAEDHGLR